MSARRQSKVEKKGFVDARYSSGDCNEPQKSQDRTSREHKNQRTYQEENNNDVDGLSKDLQMGCIVDAVKRPPNICVETCIYEGTESEESNNELEEDAYSEEFEEDHSDGDESIKMDIKSAKSDTASNQEGFHPSSIKLSKSHSFMSSKQNESVSGKSGKSSQYGSLRVPYTRRTNMSFTNERLREIERENHILLKKILSARNHAKSTIPPAMPAPAPIAPPNAAAISRKKAQRKIDYENMILLRKIQRAKSSACSMRN